MFPSDQGVYLLRQPYGRGPKLFAYHVLIDMYLIVTFCEEEGLRAFSGSFSDVLDLIPIHSVRMHDAVLRLENSLDETICKWSSILREYMRVRLHRPMREPERRPPPQLPLYRRSSHRSYQPYG